LGLRRLTAVMSRTTHQPTHASTTSTTPTSSTAIPGSLVLNAVNFAAFGEGEDDDVVVGLAPLGGVDCLGVAVGAGFVPLGAVGVGVWLPDGGRGGNMPGGG